MCIFDRLKKSGNDSKMETPKERCPKTETFVFSSLPESLEELKNLKEADLSTPFKTASLTVLALCAFATDQNIGKEMLDYLRGPRPLSPRDISFLKDRFMDGKTYLPFSYFEGATPENDYTPQIPYTLKITATEISFKEESFAKLFFTTKGADSPRFVELRLAKDGRWYLWEQFLLVSIREPKSKIPWA